MYSSSRLFLAAQPYVAVAFAVLVLVHSFAFRLPGIDPIDSVNSFQHTYLQEPSSGLAGLLLYPSNVLAADGVPGGHVLLHALADAGLLAGGEGCAWLWNALLKAVLVKLLRKVLEDVSINRGNLVMPYLNQLFGVVQGGFLANLVHEDGLWVIHFG